MTTVFKNPHQKNEFKNGKFEKCKLQTHITFDASKYVMAAGVIGASNI